MLSDPVLESGAPSRYLPDASDFTAPIRISLAAPAFNEEGGIRPVVESWHRYLAARRDIETFEIVICNDGSRDATGAILEALASEHREVRPIQFPRNQGAAAALAAAIAATSLNWVLLIDSDGQFPIENLENMLNTMRRLQVPAVIGIRQKKLTSLRGLERRPAGWYATWCTAARFVISIRPSNWFGGRSFACSPLRPRA